MDFDNLLFMQENHTAIVTINRPDKLNALDSKTLTELKELFTHIHDNDDIHVVILTGAGQKAFVAGADIKELNSLDVLSGKEFAEFGQEVFNQIENLEKPVIAAVNGYALGGGCELALASHIRYASTKAMFGQPEVNLGVIPGYGGTQRLARLVSTGIAAELILSADMIDAQEAYRIGLVNKVFEPDQLLEKAKDLAAKISTKGQTAVKMAVKAIVSCDELSEKEGQKLESSLFAVCCGTEDFKEGTNAFLEKRKPNFTGK